MTKQHTQTGAGEGSCSLETGAQSVASCVNRERWGTLFVTALCAALFVAYAYLFWDRVSPYWFHPEWTTDDGLQQLYSFHKVQHPNLFKGDLVTEMIEGYFTPLHYWLSYGVTVLTGNPIMTGHWVMLIQMVTVFIFLFLAVRQAAGTIPAIFACTWYLHTRHVMQRITSGLPRGWSPLVFTAFFYFALSGNHWGVLAVILVGCLLHPPGTAVVIAAYGLYLAYRLISPKTRSEYFKKSVTFALTCFLGAAVTLPVLKRPEHIGPMVTYEQASQMPEFQRPLGRFPFVPLREPWDEIRSFSFQAFVTRFYNPGRFWKQYTPTIVLSLLSLLVLAGIIRRRQFIPLPVLGFFGGSLFLYFASRALAFKLYVPDRHLQIPMATFFVVALTIGVWRFFVRASVDKPYERFPDLPLSKSWPGLVGLVLLGWLVVATGNDGLNGAMNFNFSADKKGRVWQWLQTNTPEEALIAGEPTLLDSVFLFGKRQGYVTTETAHPFYPKYNEEMQRRLAISLRAHYARDLGEMYDILKAEKIDYFILDRRQFYPEALKAVTYFPPLDTLAKQLASYPYEEYAFRKLPSSVDLVKAPYMPYRDKFSVVIDVKKLGEALGR